MSVVDEKALGLDLKKKKKSSSAEKTVVDEKSLGLEKPKKKKSSSSVEGENAEELQLILKDAVSILTISSWC